MSGDAYSDFIVYNPTTGAAHNVRTRASRIERYTPEGWAARPGSIDHRRQWCDGAVKARKSFALTANVSLALPGEVITLNTPSDAWVAGPNGLLELGLREYTCGERDAEFVLVGRYIGSCRVQVMDNAKMRELATRTAIQHVLGDHPDVAALVNGSPENLRALARSQVPVYQPVTKPTVVPVAPPATEAKLK